MELTDGFIAVKLSIFDLNLPITCGLSLAPWVWRRFTRFSSTLAKKHRTVCKPIAFWPILSPTVRLFLSGFVYRQLHLIRLDESSRVRALRTSASPNRSLLDSRESDSVWSFRAQAAANARTRESARKKFSCWGWGGGWDAGSEGNGKTKVLLWRTLRDFHTIFVQNAQRSDVAVCVALLRVVVVLEGGGSPCCEERLRVPVNVETLRVLPSNLFTKIVIPPTDTWKMDPFHTD